MSTPVSGPVAPTRVRLALAALLGSAVALALVPVAMPADYSWVANTISEAGAQGVDGAWLARSGLLLFGLGALLVVAVVGPRWHPAARWLHGAFAVLLIASAVFSTRSWTGAPFDRVEDSLHSVAATAMGFAFALGVVAVLFLRPPAEGLVRRVVGVVAVVASVAIPLGMMGLPQSQGLLQRLMFTVAYVWFGTELLFARRR